MRIEYVGIFLLVAGLFMLSYTIGYYYGVTDREQEIRSELYQHGLGDYFLEFDKYGEPLMRWHYIKECR